MANNASPIITSWKLSLPCTKAEADAIALDPMPLDLDPSPAILTSEPDPTRPHDWLLDAYFDHPPTAEEIALVRTLNPSADGIAETIIPIADADWLTMSQSGLEPIRAGRFYVYTPVHADSVPADMIGFEIEASRAFGTGHHETTTGCLIMLDRMKSQGLRFTEIADIGTGTGLLAFAAQKLWPTARMLASDIDPVSIEITIENCQRNGITHGIGRHSIALAVAEGMDHRLIQQRSPYDLIIANILAGPLIDMAASIAQATLSSGSVILAGLLQQQADDVIAAYRWHGMRLADRYDNGDWPTLRLIKR